jgi:N-acetylglucosamine kinase-like BadF-type ATPase
MTLYLGIDGGGTKTEFVCIDADHNLVARAVTGTSYHLQVGFDEAMARITQGIADVCGQLSVTPAALDHVFLGLPAFGEDSVIDARLDAACGQVLGHGRYRCDNDMVCGWAGSLGCQDGINIVAGTGSIGYGERHGIGARIGGWGEMFSDEGSAHWIAIQGLNAFTRMSDGRLPTGPLHGLLTQALGLSADLDLCARVLGPPAMPRDEVASLSVVVAQAAEQGDGMAAEILDRAGAELASMAAALHRRLGFAERETALLSWSGGVLTRQQRVRDSFLCHLDGHARFVVIEPLHPPGLGAALYAARLASRNA